MAANKKPRKAYHPKPCGVPMTIRHNDSDDNMLKMMGHSELLKLENGDATDGSWHQVVCRLNLGARLNDVHFSGDAQTVIGKAWDSMIKIRERFERVGKWGALPQEIITVRDALVIVDDVQDLVTRRELRDAINFVMQNASS